MDRWQYLFVLAACLAVTAPLESRVRRLPAAPPQPPARSSGGGRVRRLGRGRDRGPRVDLQPAVHQRARAAGVACPSRNCCFSSSSRCADYSPTTLSTPSCGWVADRRGGAVGERTRLHSARCRGGDRVVALEALRRPHRSVPPTRLLDLDAHRGRLPDLVDGWLTKLSAPIVLYDEHHTSGIRFPFDIPVEDFLFGWAMVTAVLLLWERQTPRDRKEGHNVTIGTERPIERGARRLRRRARPPTTRSSAPTPDTTRTFASRRERMQLPDAAAACACSTRAAAQAHRPPRCWPRRRRRRSSASTGPRACWPRRRAKPWPSSVRFVHSRIEDLADAGVIGPFDGIFAAYLLRNLPDPDANCRRSVRCCGPAPRWPCTSTRCATPGWPPRCGTRCARRSSSRPAGCARGDAGLYRYLRRSVNRFDGAAAFRSGSATTGSPQCAARRCRAGSATSCTRSLRRRPDDRSAPRDTPRAGRPARRERHCAADHVPSSSAAGIAGLAAATGLAERGVAVDVVERQQYLGGRVGGWTEARSATAPRGRDEPWIPRVLPAVLQPARSCCAASIPNWRC